MIAENRKKVSLSRYNNSWYNPKAGIIKRTLWYFTNVIFFINPLNPFSLLKIYLLRLFGAKIGRGVVIKPGINIKYPWMLQVGDNTWLGENVWVDNLANVYIGNNVTLSQGAMLLTGSHDYKKSTFDLIVGNIKVEDGAWIGAKAIVCPNAICRTHCVLAAGSVATDELAPYTIYQGNPAEAKRKRILEV